MVYALLFITLIFVSAVANWYLRRKYDVSDHVDKINEAVERNRQVRIVHESNR